MTTNKDTSLATVIGEQPLFKGLAPQYLDLLAEAAMLKEFAAGEVIFREGDPANRFYLILDGEVALESMTGERGLVLLQTIGANDVLGWSWLFPPYYWHFDARAYADEGDFLLRHMAARELRTRSQLRIRNDEAHGGGNHQTIASDPEEAG